MRRVDYYRYFFGFRPPVAICRYIAAEAGRRGIVIVSDQLAKLHVTLCVVAELPSPDAFIAKRADTVLGKALLGSCRVNLGRFEAGPEMAMLNAFGRQGEIRAFYKQLIGLIGDGGMTPMYRKSGLNAHISLAHGGFAYPKDRMPVSWYPDELLLIESHVGAGKHVVVGRWPLLPPIQGELDLCA